MGVLYENKNAWAHLNIIINSNCNCNTDREKGFILGRAVS